VLTPCTVSLNETDRFADTLTPVAPTPGVRAVTVGATLAVPAVVNVQLVDTSGAPAESRIADAPPVKVTVYTVPDNKLPLGFNTREEPDPDTTADTVGPVVTLSPTRN
jgi:hypothetical protein